MAEKPVLVSLEDILAAGWHCPHCGTILSVPFDRLDRGLPGSCANCNEVLAKGERIPGNSDHKRLNDVLFLLADMRKQEFAKNIRFQIVQETEENT